MLGLGYDGDLFILAFDHRGSFVKKFFGIEGTPSPEDALRIADAKTVIYEGFQGALEGGVDRVSAGILVDEQFGGEIAKRAASEHLTLAMPVEKSGLDEFDFEYGDDFGSHIQHFEPDVQQGPGPVQPRGRRRAERPAGRAPQAALRMAAPRGAEVPVRAARPGRAAAARSPWAATRRGSTRSCGPT